MENFKRGRPWRSFAWVVGGLLCLSAEVVYLRHAFHGLLGPNLTALGMFGRDFYLPVLLGLGFLLVHSERKGDLRFRLSLKAAIAHAVVFAAVLFCFRTHYFFILRGAAGAWVFLTLAFCSLLLVSSVHVWLDLKALVQKLRAQGSRLLILVAALGLLSIYPRLIEWNWFWLIQATGGSVYFLLKALGWNVSLFDMAYSVGISHRWFRASINMSCSGMEAMTFFVFSYLIYLYTSPEVFSWRKALLAGAIGVLTLFCVNLVRIVAFLIVAITLNAYDAPGSVFFSWAFHANAGWLLYLAAIAAILSYLKHRPMLLAPSR